MRRSDREVTNKEDILKILDKVKVLHLGLFDGEYPYIVPLHYGYEETDGVYTFYMHGAKEGHKLNLIKDNSKVCIELETDVALISGGDTACMYGATFASIIARGEAFLVSDVEEKVHGLKVLMKHQTHKEFHLDEKMASSVAVIKVVVNSLSAKARTNL